MEDLKKQSEQLAEKQSHVRKAFQKLLERWEKATGKELNDENLEYVFLSGWKEPNWGWNQLFLRRGVSELRIVRAYDFAHVQKFENAIYEEVWDTVNIQNCDMKNIRIALKAFPEMIDDHIKDLEKSGNEIDKLVSLVK